MVPPGQRGAGGPSQGNGSGNGVIGSIAEFGNDVATLVELQAKLAAIDSREVVVRATWPVVALGTALAVLLAGVPVALLGVADLIARATGIAAGWAMLLTAAAAIAFAGLIAFLSVREFTRSLEPLRRSREELVRNLAWLRTVLVYSGRSFPRRGS